jgi:hypothetical protein
MTTSNGALHATSPRLPTIPSIAYTAKPVVLASLGRHWICSVSSDEHGSHVTALL